MASLARMHVDLIARTEKFQRDIEGATKSFQRAGESMQRVGLRMSTRVTLPLAAVGAAAVKMAVDAEESANKFNVVMGDAADDVRARFRELHDTIPLTLDQMEALAAGVQDLLVPLGLARGEAANMSADMVELAGDLASFNNVAADVPLDAIKSALAGMSRPLRAFGVDVSQARLETLALEEGLIGVGEELDSAARAQAVMLAVQRDSSDAMGDAARTADSAANTLRFFTRDVKELGQMIGEILVPHVVVVVQRLNEVLRWLRDLDPATQKWIVGITAAAAALGPLLIVLGSVLKALGGLALVLTPAGAVIGGLTLLATVLAGSYVQASIEASKATRELEESLSAAAREMRQLDEAAQVSALRGFQRGALEARQRVEELNAELEKARQAPATGQFGIPQAAEIGRISAELAEAESNLETLTRLATEAAFALTETGEAAGEAAGGAEEVTQATEATNRTIREQIDLLGRAQAVGVQKARVWSDLIDLERRLRAAAADTSRSFEQQVQDAEELEDVLDLLARSMVRIEIAGENMLTGLMDLPDGFGRIKTESEESAQVFEQAWLTAINVVGASLGGLASQLANVVTAFQTGGPVAGGAAFIGMALNQVAEAISGGGERIRQAAQEFEKAMDAFANIASDQNRFAALQAQAEKIAQTALMALLRGMDPTKLGSVIPIIRQIEAGGGKASDALEALGDLLGPEGAQALEAYKDALERIERLREAEIQSMKDDVAVRMLVAQGRDSEAEAMRVQIRQQEEIARALALGGEEMAELWRELHQMEDAAREAAQAERELADQRRAEAELARESARAFEEAQRAYEQFVNTVHSLTQRIANLRGDRIGGLRAGHAMEVFNLPDDTPSEIRELIGWIQAVEMAQLERDILLQEVNEAMERDLEAIRTAAEEQIDAIRKAAQAQIAILDEQLGAAQEQLAVSRQALQEQERLVQSIQRVVSSLDQSLDQMLLGPNSPLDPISQLEEARRQFETLRDLAMGGDLSAAQALPGALRALLEASGGVNASGPGFVEDFEKARAAMELIRDRFADQLTVEEQMLEQLRQQTEHLQSQIDSLRAQRDAIQRAAQEQIGAIRDQAELQMAAVRDAAAAQMAEIERQHNQAMSHAWTMIGHLLDILNSALEQERLLKDIRDNPNVVFVNPGDRGTTGGSKPGPTRPPRDPASSGPMQVVDPVAAENAVRLENRLASLEETERRIERQLANLLAGG